MSVKYENTIIGKQSIDDLEKRGSISSVRPTLYIGLGGSGKETLLRLRKLFYKKNLAVGLPITSYLWVDTDINNHNIAGEELSDELTSRVRFSTDETCDLRVYPNELSHIYKNMKMHPSIESWFHHEALQSVGGDAAISTGAGQVRPFGKLAFYHHFPKIKDSIKNKLHEINMEEKRSLTEKMGYKVDNITEIVIVTSIAGGTGSGCFIDMSFLCKYLYPDAYITKFLYMPSVFERSGLVTGQLVSKIQANGYAALMELDNVMRPDYGSENFGVFDQTFYWDDREHKVSSPPAKTVYLIDYANFEKKYVEDKTDSFQMVAEFLELDMERSSFSDIKRSNRSNLEQLLINWAQYRVYDDTEQPPMDFRKYFPSCYSSFGLSMFTANRKGLANAASYYFAKSMVEHWLGENVEINPEFRDSIKSENENNPGFLLKIGIDIEKINETLISDKHGLPCYTEMNEEFKLKLGELQSSIKAKKGMDGLDCKKETTEFRTAIKQIKTKIINETKKKLGEFDIQSGDHAMIVDYNKSELQNRINSELTNKMVDMLCNTERYGPRYAEELLNITETWILDKVDKAKENKRALGLRQEEILLLLDIDKEEFFDQVAVENLENELHEIENNYPSGTMCGFMYKEARKRARAMMKTSETISFRGGLDLMDKLVGEWKSLLGEWVKNSYNIYALEHTMKVMQEVLGHVGHNYDRDKNAERELSGLALVVKSYVRNLSELKKSYNMLYETYKQVKNNYRYRSIADQVDFKRKIIEHLQESGSLRSEISYYAHEQTDEFFRTSNLMNANDDRVNESIAYKGVKEILRRSQQRDINESQWIELSEQLEKFCFKLFRDFLAGNKMDILQLLRSKYETEANLRDEFKNVLNYALPKFERAEFASYKIQYDQLVGINRNDTFLEEVLKSAAGHVFSNAKYITTGQNDTISFYSEATAFPLYFMDYVWKMKEAYTLNSHDRSIYQRHSFKEFTKLRDIVPPKDGEEVKALVDASLPMLKGLMLGELKVNSKGNFYMKAKDLYNTNELVTLGTDLDSNEKILAGMTHHQESIEKMWNELLREYIHMARESFAKDGKWLDSANMAKPGFEEICQLLCLMLYTYTNVFREKEISLGGITTVKLMNMRRRSVHDRMYKNLYKHVVAILLNTDRNDIDDNFMENHKEDVQDFNQYIDTKLAHLDDYTQELEYNGNDISATIKVMRR